MPRWFAVFARRMSALAVFPVSCAVPSQLRSTAAADVVKVAASCTPERNHCIRDETWFWIEAAYADSEGRAIAVHQKKSGRWYTYAGERALGGHVLRTAVAIPDKTKPKDVLIVYRPNDGEPPWPVSEEAAQDDHARWRVMVVDKVDLKTGTFTIKVREDMPVKLANARRVLESRDLPSTKPMNEPEEDE